MNSKDFRGRAVRKAILTGLSFVSTAAAGAVTVHTVYAYDKNACTSFRDMVMAADVAHMTDGELCSFRFSSLPATKARGFAFPSWSEMPVADPVETFRKISLGNNPPGKHYLGSPGPDILKSVLANSESNNLKFYRARVHMDGDGPLVTLLDVDTVSCLHGRLNNDMGAPALFAFNDQGLTKQEPMQPSSFTSGGAEVALWKGSIPVRLSMSSSWVKTDNVPGKVLVVDLMGWSRRKPRSTHEYFYAYPVCSISLNQKD